MSTPEQVAVTVPVASHRDKEEILAALRTWVNQRPGISGANYDSIQAFWKVSREVSRDLRDAEKLLRHIQGIESISALDLFAAFREASGGCLQLIRKAGSPVTIRFVPSTTGQWPLEFRKAVSAGLALAIQRDFCAVNDDFEHMRKHLAKVFSSPGLVARWFKTK